MHEIQIFELQATCFATPLNIILLIIILYLVFTHIYHIHVTTLVQLL